MLCVRGSKDEYTTILAIAVHPGGPAMSTRTASQVFTCEELWLLQSVIRHEIPQLDQWDFPPASVDLNDQIAQALVLCDENNLGEAALLLTRGDCLVIDYCVPQGAKSVAGVAIGKSVLMKSFRARRTIETNDMPSADEPAQPTVGEVREHLRHMQGD